MARCKGCSVGLLGACGVDYCRQEREAMVEQAERLARQYGHALTSFSKVKRYPIWQARCVHCGQRVSLNLDPKPNEPDISGPVVEAECPALARKEGGEGPGVS